MGGLDPADRCLTPLRWLMRGGGQTRMLDIIQDYCWTAGYDLCRIDGGMSVQDREAQLAAFVAPDSAKFLFLLSTRAGGLGLNLVAADVVIIFDR